MQENWQDWTVDVSSYLATRQMQTAQAYGRQSVDSKQVVDSKKTGLDRLFTDTADVLFSAVFSLLAQALEQGHTVVSFAQIIQTDQTTETSGQKADVSKKQINQDKDDKNDKNNKGKEQANSAGLLTDLLTGLPNWQVDFIQGLLPEGWLSENSEGIISSLSTNITDSKQLVEQIFNAQSLSQSQSQSMGYQAVAEDEAVSKRRYLLTQIIDFFKAFNELTVSSSQPNLQIFASHLSQTPWFATELDSSDINEQLATQNLPKSPIVLRLSTNKALTASASDNASASASEQLELTFWIQRSWYAEQSVIQHIQRLNHATPPSLDLSHIHQDIDQSSLNPEQLSAIETANGSAFCIITGGPGTGKTYTVAQLVIALHHANQRAEQAGESPLSLVLSAPTGKAAQRMQESLQDALAKAGISMLLQEAKTIHRLLGIGQSGTPRYNQEMPLSEDVIIVDEASMLGVELANSLLSAVKTGARLILLGDSHQLSAVEAGAVLSDLCQMKQLEAVHASLLESRRFTADSAVGQLARFINQPNTSTMAVHSGSEPQANWARLHELFASYQDLQFYDVDSQAGNQDVDNQIDDSAQLSESFHSDGFTTSHSETSNTGKGNSENISLETINLETNHETNNETINKTLTHYPKLSTIAVYQQLASDYHDYFIQSKKYLDKLGGSKPNTQSYNTKLDTPEGVSTAEMQSLQDLLAVFNQFRILTAGHKSRFGDDTINDILSQRHRRILKLPISNNEWYHGRPVMVRRNNYALGLFNGDIGICVQLSAGLAVYFEGREQPIAINMLANLEVSTAYAMTVHKSQGSEFTHVAIMLDVGRGRSAGGGRLLSREMLYTGVTRAKKQVSIYATIENMQKAITSPTVRLTGLADIVN